MDNQKQRFQSERDSLKKNYDTQKEKIDLIRKEWIYETDITRKFQLEHKIEDEQEILNKIGEDLNNIEQKLDLIIGARIEDKIFSEKITPEKIIAYTKLRDLLIDSNWKEADRETYKVMNECIGGNWSDQNLFNFPVTDITTINDLWLQYSNYRFGFSVQKKIYLEVGGKPKEYKQDAWRRLSESVGWRVDGVWIQYHQINFDISATKGHLPAWMGNRSFWPDNVLSLLSHPNL
ncbi:GUN4 domain-containing protein [Aliinostoc sp. HNIBRCY26]|uniref:GUN4 domain-containing protein n=1 Tax=Aliinostoc sp. HNIBRCY26 TaxID=3418997 RepID=UPI003CFE679B